MDRRQSIPSRAVSEGRLLDSNPTVTARAFLSMSPESEDGSGIAIRWGMVAGFPGSGAL